MKSFFLTSVFTIIALLVFTKQSNAQNSKISIHTKEQLRNLIDDYAALGDEKKIAEVAGLFTVDGIYKVYMNGELVADISGSKNIEKQFNVHASQVKTYFTMNGQHTVKFNSYKISGISFSQIKMIRNVEGKDILTDYSVRYNDVYAEINGKWFIKERVGHFIIVEGRPLTN